MLGQVHVLDPQTRTLRRLTEREASDIAIKDAGGRLFLASRDDKTYEVSVVESGPVRAVVRMQGKHRDARGRSLLDFDILATVTAATPCIGVSYAFVNREDAPSKRVRDISLSVGVKTAGEPFAMFDCGVGVFRHSFLKGHELFQIQRDQHAFETYQGPKGGPHIEINSGGCSGARANGWVGLASPKGAVTFAARNYWQQWPKALRVDKDSLSFAVWPEEANSHIARSKRILSLADHANPWQKHRRHKYEAGDLHPYVSGFSREQQCFDVVQGMAKTHEMMFCFSPESGFDLDRCRRFQTPLEVALDAEAVRDSGAIGDFGLRKSGRLSPTERMIEKASSWLKAHGDAFDCYGLMDFGDVRYMALLPETEMMEGYYNQGRTNHPRVGNWNNNEDDLVRALMFHYLRTGDARSFKVGCDMAQHLSDVDVRHHAGKHPVFTRGLITHAPGHCFRPASIGGMDHAWFHGVFWCYFLTGDPRMKETLDLLSEVIVHRIDSEEVRFDLTNLRVTALCINNLNFLYMETQHADYLKLARGLVDGLLPYQQKDGCFPGTGPKYAAISEAERMKPAHDLFMMHALEALGNFAMLSGNAEAREAFLKGVDWVIGHRLAFGGRGFSINNRGYHPNSSIQMTYVLGIACRCDPAHANKYRKTGKDFIKYLIEHQVKDTPRRGGGGWWQMNTMEIRPLGPPDAVYYIPYFLDAMT